MSERQVRGAATLFLFLLVAMLVGGIAWRSLPDEPDAAPPAVRPAASDVSQPEPSRQVVIPAGWRAEQVAGAIERAGLGDGERFLELVRHPSRVRGLAPDWKARRSLEGYLLPGIYELPPSLSEPELVAEMVGRFERDFTPALRRRAAALHLSVDEVVTLASIVQKEILFSSEAPVVAGVFFNRLERDMPLQTDPTVIYALESAERGEPALDYWSRRLDRTALRVDSLYNTYLHEGLPPGPISLPSMDTIQSVLYPARVPYLFFVAKGTGVHAFATTYREQQRNIDRFIFDRWPGSRRKPSELERLARTITAPLGGHVGVIVQNLATGERAALNESDFFTTASLYKLAVMLAAFERREQGRLSFDEVLRVSPAAAAEDSAAVYARLGPRPTVAEAIENMIVVSGNAAGITLLQRLGRHEVNRVARAYGLKDTSLSEGRMVTTPRDVSRLLELIAMGRAVSPAASAEMRRILLRQEIDEALPRYLPRRVRIAHKTGSLASLRHDAGIIYTAAGPVLVVAMTEGVKDEVEAMESIGRLGKIVVSYFRSYGAAVGRVAETVERTCRESPFRPRAPGLLSGRTIVLDPGHGGRGTPGATGATVTFADGRILVENEVTLDVALRLKDLLVAEGATVHMTRCWNVFVPLLARAALANSVDPDLFVSVHVNGSDDPEEDGTNVYYFSPRGKVLANYLLGAFGVPALWQMLNERMAVPNEGVHRADYGVLVFTRAPAALTESVFMTDRDEAASLRPGAAVRGSRRAQIALGHLRGILNYFGVRRPSAVPVDDSAPPRRGEVRDFDIVASGDLLIQAPIWRYASALGGGYPDFRPLLARIRPIVSRAALALCHVETPLGAGPPSSFPLMNAPAELADAIRWAGWDACSTASNHSLDKGELGIETTSLALDRAGVAHTGSFRSSSEARELLLLRVRGLRVAFLSYTQGTNGIARPGPWSVNLLSLRKVAADATSARRLGADLVVANFHWGVEYSHRPTARQRFLARYLLKRKLVDVIVGQHAHVVQPIRRLFGRFVVFSEGNLLSNQTGKCCPPETQDGLISVIHVHAVGRRATVTGVDYVPIRVRHPGFVVEPVGFELARLARRGLAATARALELRGSYLRTVRFAGKGRGIRPLPPRLPATPDGAKAATRPLRLEQLGPREKAALLVVSGLPAPEAVAGVLVQRWSRDAARPPGALVVVDQEGGPVRAFPGLPPDRAAADFRRESEAFAVGRETGRALRRAGAHIDLAPVLDAGGGPLGERHFRRPALAVAFARGLAAARVGACAKHFPGLGSAPASTDEARVRATVRADELAGFRAAIRAGVPCVMVGHAVYPELGRRPASLEPAAYLLLRRMGFDGVAVTDALEALGGSEPAAAARRAVKAGADVLLFTSGDDARRAIEALVPLARAGLLDQHVTRVLRLRRALGR